MKKALLLSLLLIGNLMAGWMNVDSINVKQKWRNKKFNTDAVLYVKSADSLLDTCNMYYKTGKIGIGTDNPTTILHVYGNTGGSFCMESPNGKYAWIAAPSVADELTLYDYTSANEVLTVTDLKFGILTDILGGPSAELHVNGSAIIEDSLYLNGPLIYPGSINFDSLTLEYLHVTGTSDFDGAVGVGTTSPSALLDVNGTSEFNNLMTIQGANGGIDINRTTGDGFVNFRDGSGVGNWTIKHYNTSNVLRMYSAGIDGILYISKLFTGTDFTFNTANGRLGIGTASPSNLLHVNGGAIRVQNTYSTVLSETKLDFQRDGGNYISAVAGTNGALTCQTRLFQRWQVNDTTRMYLNNAGYLGIGTDNPVYPLQIHKNAADCRMQITNSSTGTAVDNGLNIIQNGLNTYIRNWENGFLRLGTNGTDNITITSSGATGVSTTTPLGKFDVSYSVNTDTPTICFGADGTLGSTSRTTSTTKMGAFGLVHYDLTEEPIATLYAYSESGVNNVVIGGGSSALNCATYLRFYTAANATTTTGSEAMTINSIGNVGIGDNIPNYKLTVNGIARSSTVHTDSLYVNDDRIRIANSYTPASASATGTAGTIVWDANYIYVCTATNTWKRTAISTW